MTDQKSHSFWSSFPGIMTGMASMLTALVAVLSFTVGNCKKEQAPEVPQLLNLSQCEEITGKWDWFTGGETTLGKDGSVVWLQQPANPLGPKVTGRWSCMSTKPRSYMLSWQHGVTDTVKLSPDGNSLSGSNPANVQVSATRHT